MKTKTSTLLVLFLLVAGPVLKISASEIIEAVGLNRIAESIQFISFNNNYPEYSILSSDTIDYLPEKTFKPWTSQIRVTGFAPVSSGLVIGINAGYPLFMVIDEYGSAELSSPDRTTAELFMSETEGLTIGTIFSESNNVFFHLYRDGFFNSSALDTSAGTEPHPVLLELNLRSFSDYSLKRHDFEFAMENPEWEPVEFIHKNSGSLITWKYSDEKKTRFRYIRHDNDGDSIDEIDKKFFRDEYNIRPVEAGSFALRGFIRAVRDGSIGDELKAAGDVYMRLSSLQTGSTTETDNASPLFFVSTAPKAVISSARRLPVQFAACPDNESWYVLADDELFICGANISRFRLPELPEGFSYVELWVQGKDMIISWEESRFPYIGRSGMMYVRLRDILN